jgi:hypothetical protein
VNVFHICVGPSKFSSLSSQLYALDTKLKIIL